MLDRHALRLLRPTIEHAAARLHGLGLSADQMTLTGFGLGMIAACLIAFGFTWSAIVPLLVSRALDGLDGALARLSNATDRGAFLDISLDFIFYGTIPLAFAVLDPANNALAAATLLAAFVATGTGFLAFAALAEKRGLKSSHYPSKTIYYLGGLTEGTETILCFLVMCTWPQHFTTIAYVYAGLCLITAASRLFTGWRIFGGKNS